MIDWFLRFGMWGRTRLLGVSMDAQVMVTERGERRGKLDQADARNAQEFQSTRDALDEYSRSCRPGRGGP